MHSEVDEVALASIKSAIAELGLFNGKRFNHRIEVPQALKAELFRLTPNCLSPHLKDRLYWIVNDIRDYALCKTCGAKMVKEVRTFTDKFKWQAYCNAACRLKDKDLREAYEQERIERTGYRIPLQDPAVRAKMEETNLSRYGVKNVSSIPEVKAKIKATVRTRYGVDYVAQEPSFIAKRKATCKERYGAEYPMQVERFKEKSRLTCLARYGVTHPMQHFKTFQKVMRSRFKFKDYRAKDGTLFKFQGYEDVALKRLEAMGIDPKDIVVGRKHMPKVFYYDTGARRRARYYPDIWVRSFNLLIEVKSDFTYGLNKRQAHEKQAACRRLGFSHQLYICSKTSILKII